MKKGILVAAISALLGCANAMAATVTAVAGGLSGAVDKTATELTVTGDIDARDLKFIAEEMTALVSLDLSNVSIKAYKGLTPCFGDKLEYSADHLPEYCFIGKNYTSVKLPATLKYIGEGAFAGCRNLADLSLPAELDSIGRYAFNSCDALTALVLPAGIEKVGTGAFSRCIGLKNVDLTALSETCELGVNLFTNCSALETATLGNKILSIPAGAFAGCESLSKVDLGTNPSLKVIGEEAFVSSGLTAFDFENCTNLVTLGRWAFANVQLSGIVLPASVESIGEGVFFYNTALKEIELPSKVVEVSDFALAGCESMSEGVVVGESVATIGRYALADAKGTVSISLPASLTYVGTRAFENNTSIAEMTVAAKAVPELGEDVFSGVNQPAVKLKVPENSVSQYKAAEQWKEFDVVGDMSTIEESIVSTSEIKAYFVEKILHVDASEVISSVNVYEANGVLLASCEPKADKVQIDMSAMAGSMYVVAVRMECGRLNTIKLIRH